MSAMKAAYGMLLLLLLFAEAKGCSWNYGCHVGYCIAENQNQDNCSCTQCHCLDSCLTGNNCTKYIDSAACNNCAKDPCPNSEFNCTNGLNTRTCQCREGRTGYSCELALGDICASYPCLNGGTCSALASNTAFTCTCSSTYAGQQCQFASNPCSSISCQHGSCQSMFNGAKAVCVCNDTWRGVKCDETAVSKSIGSPTCINFDIEQYLNSSSVTSSREKKMTQEKCESKANSADSSFFVLSNEYCFTGGSEDPILSAPAVSGIDCLLPCPGYLLSKCGGNGVGLRFVYTQTRMPLLCNGTSCNSDKKQGYCVEQQAGYTCVCAPGWTSSNCELAVDPCADPALACNNGATCLPTLDHSAAVCICPGGYSGSTCNDKDGCFFNTCQNGGRCESIDTAGAWRCDCPKWFSGQNCENYLACTSNPCIHGAACNDIASGAYHCECSAGYFGVNCERDINECVEAASINFTMCENFGTCMNTIGSYRCLCINGTSGFNCSINPDDCLTAARACNLTDTDALCVDGFNNYSCRCSEKYTGDYCQMSWIVFNTLKRLGGEAQNEEDLIKLMEQLVVNPSKTKEIIPFVVGALPERNRTALSWSSSDMFLWVTYEEKTLNNASKDLYAWNDVVLGNCFTFNHFNNTARSYLMRQDGAQGALTAAVRINTPEYAPWIETTGIMVFIHPNKETIFSESPRYYITGGADTTLQTTMISYERLGGRYNRCIMSRTEVEFYFYEGTYTTDGCFRSCYQVEVEKYCGCMDTRYPAKPDANLCRLKDVNCVDAVVSKGDVSTWADCDCPLACENSEFKTSFTTAPFVRSRSKCNSYTREQRMNDTACNTRGEEPDYGTVSIRIPSLRVVVYKEIPAMTLNTVIGNIGGLGGVVCGINLITFFEFGIYFFVQVPMLLIFGREIR